MENGEGFNEDTILAQSIRWLVERYAIRSIVETGTWLGFTARALAGMADQVYTVEVNNDFFRQAQQVLAPLGNVRQFLGRSVDLLPSLLALADRPTLYYLDAHWHGNHPLPEEIAIIAAHDPAPILVMHDMQVPGHPELKYDPQPNGQPYSFAWVEPALQKLQRPWKYFYNEKAAGCQVGVLFVVPAEPPEAQQ